MSFILDALRKSDAERQRAATPGLADVRYAPRESRRNVWLPVLVVVLAANALFLAAQWWRREPAPPVPPAVAPAATGDVAAPAPPADVEAPAAIRPLAREAESPLPLAEPDIENEFAAAGPVEAGTVPAPVVMEAPEMATGQPAVPVAAPAVAPVAPVAPPATPAKPSRILPGDDLPSAEELMGKGVLNVPPLNLDLHVYSDTPANRFVVINTRKYKEGGQLPEGPRVEAITRDGVILSNQGRRFTLTRK